MITFPRVSSIRQIEKKCGWEEGKASRRLSRRNRRQESSRKRKQDVSQSNSCLGLFPRITFSFLSTPPFLPSFPHLCLSVSPDPSRYLGTTRKRKKDRQISSRFKTFSFFSSVLPIGFLPGLQLAESREGKSRFTL